MSFVINISDFLRAVENNHGGKIPELFPDILMLLGFFFFFFTFLLYFTF